MAKSVIVEDKNGKEYVLEFTRKAAERIEKQGFDITQMGTYPVTQVSMLFHAAFLKNYSYIKRETTDEIYESQKGKFSLVNYLVEMYVETVQTLVGDEEPCDEENPTWRAT